jgi:23S rRNA pseudouridine2457 synthase
MDDGPLIHRLTDPRYQHTRTYLVQIEGVATEEAVQTLQSQIVLPGIQTRPAQAEIISEPGLPARSRPVRDYHPTTWLRIVISEGKKHQVRRMTAAVGLPTLRLVRVTIGPITLGDLQAGEWSDLTTNEIQRLRFAVKSSHGKHS